MQQSYESGQAPDIVGRNFADSSQMHPEIAAGYADMGRVLGDELAAHIPKIYGTYTHYAYPAILQANAIAQMDKKGKVPAVERKTLGAFIAISHVRLLQNLDAVDLIELPDVNVAPLLFSPILPDTFRSNYGPLFRRLDDESKSRMLMAAEGQLLSAVADQILAKDPATVPNLQLIRKSYAVASAYIDHVIARDAARLL